MQHATILESLGSIPGNETTLPMLVDQMRTPVGVIPFIGAGASAPFGFPQWTKFLLDAAKPLGKTRAIQKRLSAAQYEEAAEDLIVALTPTAFQDLLESKFGDRVLDGRSLAGAITLVPQLSSGPVITTNFDRLLERVFREGRCPFDTVVWHSKVDLAVRALERNGAVLLKLHGDWEDAEHRVLTLSEYRQHYGDADAAVDFNLPLPQLFKLLAVRPVLFIGCSLSDDRTLKVLRQVSAALKTSRHYAVVQKPKSVAKFRERTRFLAEHNIRPIWYPEGEHAKIQPLLEYLCEQVPRVFRRKKAPADGAVPRPLSDFVGREAELRTLREYANHPGLLTITGGPGAGKTRLAMKLAELLAPAFDSVWFVELSQLAEAHLVPQRVAAVLGIREQARQPPSDALAEFLREGKCLVVLDNCEHVVEACAALAYDLLSRCPSLTIVVTSRELLRVAGEQVYRVPPLALPDLDALPALNELKRIDSIALFLKRAGPDLELTEDNAANVAALSRALEGIPLAIELAAAQLSGLSVRQILNLMDERLRLLTGGTAGSVERQWRTLREAIQFSYDRLAPDRRALFRRLAVFSRGCTWEAATEICRADGQDRFAVLELLGDLHARSLVVAEDGREEKRFRMLDSIREFAQSELEASGERAAIEEKHALWFVSLAERAAPELLKKEQARWLDLMSEDADNLRGAILWSVSKGKTEIALRLVSALWRLTEIRGFLREGRERLEAVLQMPDAAQYPALRSKALSGAGMLAYRQGDMASAGGYFAESLSIERARNDPAGMANALNDLGNVAQMQGDFESAAKYYNESLERERLTNNARGVAVALFNLGSCARRLGKLDEAQARFEQSRQAFEAAGNLREAAFPLNGLGLVALARGKFNEALLYAERSLDIRLDLADKKGVADGVRTVGAVRLKQGRFPEALAYLSGSIEGARGVEDRRGIAESLELFASAAAAQKAFEKAVTLYAAAEQIREQTLVQLAPLERAERNAELDLAREALGDEDYERAFERGRAMSVAAAIEMTASVPGRVIGRRAEAK